MILEPYHWALACIGAFLIGLGKGGLPGMGNLTIAIFAVVFPAKASVGILLPVLICADVVAVLVYRKHAQWKYVGKLFPWTAVGVVFGFFLLGVIQDRAVQILIGCLLLVMTGVHFFRKWVSARWEGAGEDPMPHTWWFVGGTGLIGGFATMVANAAGPVAAMYYMAIGLPKYAFIGTGAWFWLLINVFKVPFHLGLDNIDAASLRISLTLGVVAMVGALICPLIVRHINQRLFEFLVWFFIIVAGIGLLVKPDWPTLLFAHGG
ncbi:MAG: sulfite exporter TauE/SafE family protein [Opitutales bacterium]